MGLRGFLSKKNSLEKGISLEKLQFVYLDSVDPTIRFEPIFYQNRIDRNGLRYSLFSKAGVPIPGYEGSRCIIEWEMAKALKRIQMRLSERGLCLKVYDAYRPNQAMEFFTKWTQLPDTFPAKAFHYPNVHKKDLHELSYLSRTSSHPRGTAVDVTICPLQDTGGVMREDFLGIRDPESLDMGVGYLCFDERSHHSFSGLSKSQRTAREVLLNSMLEEGFIPLETEFWHYYFMPKRNSSHYFNFPIRDDYPCQNGGIDQKVLYDF